MKKMIKFLLIPIFFFILGIGITSCSSSKVDGVTFEDQTFTYDGEVHSLSVTNLPSNITVEYLNNKQTEAGKYKVIANFTDTTGIKKNIKPLTAMLVIEKANYDMSGITFEDCSYAYDGKEKEITINGTLPTDVTVAYENNTRTNAGTNVATAKFFHTNKNYNQIKPLTAKLTIEQGLFDYSSISFKNKSFVYDGKEHSLELEGSLPNGVVVTYNGNNVINAGEYEVVANLYDKNNNYSNLKPLTAKIVIEKADYDISNLKFEDGYYIYDGTEKQLLVEGLLPKGVSVVYSNNKLTNVGSIDAYAKFINLNPNYNNISPMTAMLTIDKADYDMSNVIFENVYYTYDGTEKELLISGTLPQGLKVKYTNNKLTKVGTREVTASFINSNKNYNDVTPLTANLTIRKGVYDTSKIAFENVEVTYDGNIHSIAISSDLPKGMTVTYENNDQTNVGEYVVKAILEDDSGNYLPIKPLTATLTITKANYNLTNIEFKDTSYVYDGTLKELLITSNLPAGLVPVYENNTLTDAGSVKASVSFNNVDPNYNEFLDVLTATLTIEKAEYDMSGITFEDQEFIYDGNPKTIEITGDLPAEISVIYENNTFTGIGKVVAKAKFDHAMPNYKKIPDMTATIFVTKQYEVTYIYDNEVVHVDDAFYLKDYTIKSIIVKGIPITNWQSQLGEYIANTKIEYDNKSNLVLYAGKNDFINNNFEYKYDSINGRYIITSYLGNEEIVKLPSTVLFDNEIITISGVGNGVFSYNRTIKEIIIPKTIAYFGDSVFNKAINLKKVTYDGSIDEFIKMKILNETSAPCYNGAQLFIQDSKIKNENKYIEVTELELNSDVSDYVFMGCESITKVTINNTVNSVGKYAFANCSNLVNIDLIQSKLTTLNEGLFMNCSLLNNFTFPSSVTVLENKVFSGCSNITKMDLNNISSIAQDSLVGTNIVDLKMNYSLNLYTFNRTTLKTLRFGDNVSYINAYDLNIFTLETLILPKNTGCYLSDSYQLYNMNSLKNIVSYKNTYCEYKQKVNYYFYDLQNIDDTNSNHYYADEWEFDTNGFPVIKTEGGNK